MSKHEGNYACAITNKRLLCAQQKLIGNNLVSVNLNTISDITMNNGAIWSIITIDCYTEKFNLAVARACGQNIYDKFNDILASVKNKKNTATPISSNSQGKSMADQLRDLKSLMDDGIITEEEFNAKKKELLGL